MMTKEEITEIWRTAEASDGNMYDFARLIAARQKKKDAEICDRLFAFTASAAIRSQEDE